MAMVAYLVRIWQALGTYNQSAPIAHGTHTMLGVWVAINKLGVGIPQCILTCKQ